MWLKTFATVRNSRSFTLFRTSPIRFIEKKSLLRDFRDHDVSIRLKYVQHKGVKGIRSRKGAYESISKDENDEQTFMTKDFEKEVNHDEFVNLDDR